MNPRSTIKKVGALVVTGGMVLAFTGAALAATPGPTGTSSPSATTLPDLKTKCEAAVDRRLGALTTLQGDVSGTHYLTSGQQTKLLGEISAEASGLTTLRAKIAGDTTLATLRTDCQAIVLDYRVYLLMIPQAHEMIAAGAVGAAGQKLTDLATKLQADIDKAKAAGRNVGDAQRDENNLKAAVAAGLGATQPVPALVNFTLPLNPAEFTNDHQNVETARADLKTGHDDMSQARGDACQVIADLKAIRAGTPTATVSPTS